MDALDLIRRVADHALTLGVFDAVNRHEPKAKPGNGISAAVWVDQITPIPSSGLVSTSVRFAVQVRLYTNMLAEPQDMIDPNLVAACDALMGAYSADFTLGGQVRSVDLLGAHGVPLSAQAGYLNVDGALFRVITITVPLIVNDAWEQTP